MRMIRDESAQQLIQKLSPSSRLGNQYQERAERLRLIHDKISHFGISPPEWAQDHQVDELPMYDQAKEIKDLEAMRDQAASSSWISWKI